jgi:hypothetical protein
MIPAAHFAPKLLGIGLAVERSRSPRGGLPVPCGVQDIHARDDHPGRRFLAGLLVPIGFVAACDSARHAERSTNSERTFLPVSDAEAWEHVPRATPPLPSWARTTIASLPASTLLQLDLDALQRAENPLGKELSGRLRWTVADANRCAYAKESAEVDPRRRARRRGVAAARRRRSARGAGAPAVGFARSPPLSARDADDDGKLAAFGPTTWSRSSTVAYATRTGSSSARPDLRARRRDAPPARMRAGSDAALAVLERTAPTAVSAPQRRSAAPPDWSARTSDELQEALERQKTRTPRVPEPGAARLARFPKPKRGEIEKRAWGRFSRGYQPVLAGAWLDATHTFAREAKLDEVLENSIFWVVTRTSDCFY